jgi:hypothetical protein
MSRRQIVTYTFAGTSLFVAAALAFCGIDGWGWFLFVAVIAML